jgi:hypothetical protein
MMERYDLNMWGKPCKIDVLQDIQQAQATFRPQRATSFLLPKRLLEEYDLTEEEAKKRYGDEIIFV